ncbi:MAG: hypothetical protein JNK40_11885 [Chromatiales bacterium]|nr:hypothetical protein [Chromatiales bacterium]
MRRAAAILLAGWLGTAGALAAVPRESTVDTGGLGPVTVYAPDGPPTSVVLFVSGDGGWNAGVVAMARHLRDWGALVAGVDVRHCQTGTSPVKTGCHPPAVAFERLAHAVEKRAGLTSYVSPILVGYSSGANLVYAIAREAPAGTFAGAISLGFCAKPAAGAAVPAAARLDLPWIVLHGALDQVCAAEATREFVAGVARAKFVLLPAVGHGYAVEANWLPQFRDAYLKLVTATTEPAPAASDIADLPLVEVPAGRAAAGLPADTFVVLLTGDGGWAGLDRALAADLAAGGVPVVALSTLRYFWRQQTPEDAGRDLGRIIGHYAAAWHRPRVLLVGYSFGANVLPFLAARLPSEARQAVRGLGLLAPASHADFEIRVADWIPGSVPQGRPVQPALLALTGVPVLCLYSTEDSDSPCPALPPARGRAVSLPGGHHFGGDSATLARELLGFMGL